MPVLSTTSVSTFSKRSERFGIPDEHARRGAAPRADHDRHRRRQPERARAGDDQHRDRVHQGIGQPRLRPDKAPDDKCRDGREHDGRHEIARNHVGQSLNRRPAALRFADHSHDLREQRVASDALGAHDKRTCAVDGSAGDSIAGMFFGRHRLARDHRLVDGTGAIDDNAVDRHLLAGPHAQPISGFDLFQGHVVLAAIVRQAPGRAAAPVARDCEWR